MLEVYKNMGSIYSEFLSALGLSGLSNLLSAVVVLLICLIIIKIVCKITDRLLVRARHLDETVRRFLRTAIKIALWVLAVIVVAGMLGIPTASLVTVVGVAGLALSLSLQNTLSNLFSGISLLFLRLFVVGDYVEIAGNTGTVQEIGLFYTTINTPDRRTVNIPNSDVMGASIVNHSREPRRRLGFTYSADYEDATEDVTAALLEAAGQDVRVLSDPAPSVFLSAFQDSTVEYTLYVWCKTEDYWPVYYGMNTLVRESFSRHGVHMSYNHLNVHLVP